MRNDGDATVVQAVEEYIEYLAGKHVLGPENMVLLATARWMAAAVERDVFSAGLWREFRAVCADLMLLDPQPSEFESIVAALRDDTIDLERKRREGYESGRDE